MHPQPLLPCGYTFPFQPTLTSHPSYLLYSPTLPPSLLSIASSPQSSTTIQLPSPLHYIIHNLLFSTINESLPRFHSVNHNPFVPPLFSSPSALLSITHPPLFHTITYVSPTSAFNYPSPNIPSHYFTLPPHLPIMPSPHILPIPTLIPSPTPCRPGTAPSHSNSPRVWAPSNPAKPPRRGKKSAASASAPPTW